MVNLIFEILPYWLVAVLHFSFYTTIMISNLHSIFMMVNKWIQACIASSAGNSNVFTPIRYSFLTMIMLVWFINLGKYK